MRKYEIGSFFEEGIERKRIDGESFESWMKKSLQVNNSYLFCSGREAIEAAVVDIQIKHSGIQKVCLLPEYTCDTVIIPFQKYDWKIYYYPVDENLELSRQGLEELLDHTGATVLFVHSYYGNDTIQNCRELIAQRRKEKQLIFVEDYTQSLALIERGNEADYYLSSLRKWFGIPDGGFLATKEQLNCEVCAEKKKFVQLKQDAAKEKRRYLQGNEETSKEHFLKINREAEQYLDENDQVCKMSSYSKNVLSDIDFNRVFLIRRKNSEYLYRALADCEKVSVLNREENCVPLYFPVWVRNRDGLQRYLQQNNIFAPALWPIPEQLARLEYVENEDVFQHLLAIPCDQRYGLKDMEYIADCIRRYGR
jgi:dTDP-4-amino-4,6-dideoxygalactose transaminase